MASCYEAIGLSTEARDCYDRLVELNPENHEILAQPAGPSRRHGSRESPQGWDVKRHRPRKEIRNAGRGKRSGKTAHLHSPNAIRPFNTSTSRPERSDLAAVKSFQGSSEIGSLLRHRQNLAENILNGNAECRREWMAVTSSLLYTFRKERLFYPAEKHQKFYGYSKEARAKSQHKPVALSKTLESTLSMMLDRDMWIDWLIIKHRNFKPRSSQCS